MTVTAKGLSIDPHLSCSNRWHTALHFQPKGNKTQEQQREKEARRSEYFTQKQFFRTVNVSGVQFKSPGVVGAERIESRKDVAIGQWESQCAPGSLCGGAAQRTRYASSDWSGGGSGSGSVIG